MWKLIDTISISIYLFIVLYVFNCFFIVFANVGDKARAECRRHGTQMVDCQRKLHGSKERVPADLLEFPHMAIVGYNPSGDEVSYQCGGSLISPTWVLTAAHCIGDSRTGPPVRVRLGTTTLEDEEQEEDLIEERNVSQWLIHPNYKPPAKYNDIALIKLSNSINLDGDIKIACLPAVDDKTQTISARASGFGKTKYNNVAGSLTMMKVELDIISEIDCNNSMKSLMRHGGALKQGILPSQICAGDLKNGGKDTCQGDSGGPLQIMPENPDCVDTFHLYVILGVTSFGRFCGFRNSPGVYTRVSQYIDWIESVVWPEEIEISTGTVTNITKEEPTLKNNRNNSTENIEIAGKNTTTEKIANNANENIEMVGKDSIKETGGNDFINNTKRKEMTDGIKTVIKNKEISVTDDKNKQANEIVCIRPMYINNVTKMDFKTKNECETSIKKQHKESQYSSQGLRPNNNFWNKKPKGGFDNINYFESQTISNNVLDPDFDISEEIQQVKQSVKPPPKKPSISPSSSVYEAPRRKNSKGKSWTASYIKPRVRKKNSG